MDAGQPPASIDAAFLRRCLRTLEHALAALRGSDPEAIEYDVFGAACVKEFELVLEQSGKLLRKRLAPYFASNRQADSLVFKDLFRHAARHGLINARTLVSDGWRYRDSRNETAHDYGEILRRKPLWSCFPPSFPTRAGWPT